ncbi:hypothetical protein [Pseudomonas sp. EL_65y_Pfl1_R32]|uniref:hypothetical protein n=1 Tax=Pseudomonas sp. EL_65y_Pfl1_R32 TaxID=3088696 RepID=UPI0030D79728
MTYTLGENHDQNYTCKCGQVERRKLTPAYKKDWRCGKCGFRLKIDMDDLNGHCYTVIRKFAEDVRVDDVVVYRKGYGLTHGAAEKSNPSGEKWYLQVAFYGGHTIPTNQYINVEVP